MLNAVGVLLFASLAPAVQRSRGAEVYVTHCASCHSTPMQSTTGVPALWGVGAATLDFYLRTGRMPAAVTGVQTGRRDERSGQRLADADIAALERFLAPAVSGGPPIPHVGIGTSAHGRALYAINCEQCHGVNGEGGGLGESTWVPALDRALPLEIAEAVRTGPGEMPRFGERQLSEQNVDDLVAYVLRLRTGSRTGIPFASGGPIPEGALGYAAMAVLIAFLFTLRRR